MKTNFIAFNFFLSVAILTNPTLTVSAQLQANKKQLRTHPAGQRGRNNNGSGDIVAQHQGGSEPLDLPVQTGQANRELKPKKKKNKKKAPATPAPVETPAPAPPGPDPFMCAADAPATCSNGGCLVLGAKSYIGDCSCTGTNQFSCSSLATPDGAFSDGIAYIGSGACFTNTIYPTSFTCRGIGAAEGLGVVDDGACTNNPSGCSSLGGKVGTGGGFGVIKEGSCGCDENSENCQNGHCDNVGADNGYGVIGKGSCNGVGMNFCELLGRSGKGVIGDNSCNSSNSASRAEFICANNGLVGDSYVGDGSCNSNGESKTCFNAGVFSGTSYIGDGSCNNNADSPPSGLGYNTCGSNGVINADPKAKRGIIMNLSCNDNGACYFNTGIIGSRSCNGVDACAHNQGVIADGCCNYANACSGAPGAPFTMRVEQGSCECDGTC